MKRGLVDEPDWRCPRHPSVDAILRCPRCARTVQEHMERVDRTQPPVVKP